MNLTEYTRNAYELTMSKLAWCDPGKPQNCSVPTLNGQDSGPASAPIQVQAAQQAPLPKRMQEGIPQAIPPSPVDVQR